MATARKELEITLYSIHIPETAAGLDTETSHLLSANLIWPRLGIAQKSAAQPCVLKEGRAALETVNWGRRILFKESVEGRFALALTLTEALDSEELEEFLRFCAGAVLSIGAGVVESAVKPVGKLAAAPLEYAAKNIIKYPGPLTLAEGLAGLDSADFPESGGERLLTLQMTAARRLMNITSRTVNGRPRISRKLLLEKGEPDGEVTLAIRTL
ncbi:MAG: hypothetical protein WCK89_17885 [bacterium]